MIVLTKDLPDFVKKSDELGGPSSPKCDAYWHGFQYVPEFKVDELLDPFGEDYVAQQISLYEEISGRALNQLSNEHTTFDIDRHVKAVNPYDHGSPSGLTEHIERLSRAIRLGRPPRGSRFLDMGCGWGLSSEVAAYCGLSVTAVDVNPDFVALVNRRAEARGADITAQHGMFDTFESEERYAMILFYECFHHALRPWDLLARMARHLTLKGRLILAGEPINAHWWVNWGLRLDALSVYCIHKFGWFESGWSANFLKAAFQRAGLTVQIVDHPEAGIGATVIGGRIARGRSNAVEIARLWDHEGWYCEQEYMTSTGASSLKLAMPADSVAVSFAFQNFRGRPVNLTIRNGGGWQIHRQLEVGGTEIEIPADRVRSGLYFDGEQWIPDEELKNGDQRIMSIHLESVTIL